MPRRVEHTPKHRGPAREPALKKGIRRSVVFSGVAVAATGIAVSSGIALTADSASTAASASLASSTPTGAAPETTSPAATSPAAEVLQASADDARTSDRSRQVSRSDRRTAVDAVKARALSQASGGQVTETEDLSTQDPRTVAKAMLSDFGFGSDQFSCLDSLYNSESGWNVHADNPSSSAYGIPQALPGSKMASAGSDWENNPATQITWGLGYIRDVYGTPCSAWGFKQGNGWY